MVRVKICGLTRFRDVQWAARLEAWAIGLIFAESPRRITPDEACRITRGLNPHVLKVGVFVNEDTAAIQKIAAQCRLNAVQLHGAESPDFCRRLKKTGLRVIKAIRMKEPKSLDLLPDFESACDFFLLDTYTPDKAGGSGQIFDWKWARQAMSLTRLPIILSGGLHPGNAEKAFKESAPYALDLSSGIEESPGKKSAQLMTHLFDSIASCS